MASGKAGAKERPASLRARKSPDGFNLMRRPVWDRNARHPPAWGGISQYRKESSRRSASSPNAELTCRLALQNGLTITRITMPIISRVGTSLIMR